MSLQAKGRVYLYKGGLKGGYTKEGGRGSKGRRCVWVCDMENRHVGGEIVNNNTTQQSSNQTQGCRRLTTQLRGDLKHVFLSSVFNQYFGRNKNIQKVLNNFVKIWSPRRWFLTLKTVFSGTFLSSNCMSDGAGRV